MVAAFEEKLERLKKESRYRSLLQVDTLQEKAMVNVDDGDDTLVNLSSNDYLGLASDKELLQSFYAQKLPSELAECALGVASSRLLTGSNKLTVRLENKLAASFGAETALVFNSGYHANIGILSALAGKGDLILSDKLNHASIYDGMRLSDAKVKRFNHCDYEQLEFILNKEKSGYKNIFVVTESVFSMDGDVADLERLVDLRQKHGFILYVDEAHAIGMFGNHGLGKCEQLGILESVDLLVGTFGKAFASVGAFVVCCSTIKEYLINFSRSFIFTTALPPVVLSWNTHILESLDQFSDRRKQVKKLSQQFRNKLLELKLKTAGETYIVPVIIGDNEKTVRLSRDLRQEGFLLLPVRPPTVPEGSSRFRISLTADISWEQIAMLPEMIATGLKR